MDETENNLVEKQPEKEQAIAAPTTMNWLDAKSLATAYRGAMMIAKSGLLPQTYQGKPENVLIAMDLASRMNMSLITVCQNLYIVQGKPAWSGQFCISAINSCGRYSQLEFVWLEEGGCFAQAKELRTGKLLIGAPVTPETVSKFGWDKKSGSMWNIPGMDKQMYCYRAAAFFARTYCPDILNGVYTKEEVIDAWGDWNKSYEVSPDEVIDADAKRN